MFVWMHLCVCVYNPNNTRLLLLQVLTLTHIYLHTYTRVWAFESLFDCVCVFTCLNVCLFAAFTNSWGQINRYTAVKPFISTINILQGSHTHWYFLMQGIGQMNTVHIHYKYASGGPLNCDVLLKKNAEICKHYCAIYGWTIFPYGSHNHAGSWRHQG